MLTHSIAEPIPRIPLPRASPSDPAGCFVHRTNCLLIYSLGGALLDPDLSTDQTPRSLTRTRQKLFTTTDLSRQGRSRKQTQPHSGRWSLFGEQHRTRFGKRLRFRPTQFLRLRTTRFPEFRTTRFLGLRTTGGALFKRPRGAGVVRRCLIQKKSRQSS